MKDLTMFNNKNILVKSLDKTAKEYRLYDPGWYLYRQIINFDGNKITSDFVQLVYVTLCAWNMNSRGAKLSDYDIFEATIFENGEVIGKLSKYDIYNFSDNKEIEKELKKLFFKLTLVAELKPKLVTFSKTMHFFLPELIVPIDRKYTLNYFNGNTSINPKIENQYYLFNSIQKEYARFALENNLEEYKDNRWNLSITKIMDNMIIGYMKL